MPLLAIAIVSTQCQHSGGASRCFRLGGWDLVFGAGGQCRDSTKARPRVRGCDLLKAGPVPGTITLGFATRSEAQKEGSTMALHHTQLRRLAFVKYLYNNAIEQSKGPEVKAAASLLMFHDCVEFYLKIASEAHGIKEPKSIMEYWTEFESKLPPPHLPERVSFERLNKARVGIKHHGNMPAKSDIEGHRETVANLLHAATPILFNMEFSAISMVDFVEPASSRDSIRSAQDEMSRGQLVQAASHIALAFEDMVAHRMAETDEFQMGVNRRFYFGDDMSMLNSFFLGFKDDRNLGRFVDSAGQSIAALQAAIRILALGLDYRRYVKFYALLPSVTRSINGTPIIQHAQQATDLLTVEYLESSINFIIDSAIILGETD